MTVNPLRIEILITGFLFLGGTVLITLTFFGVSDISIILPSKELSTIFLLLGISFSYVFGILAHRLTTNLTGFIKQFLKENFKKLRIFEYYDRPEKEVYENIVKGWQWGSERLHRGLNYHFSLLVLFRLLTIGIFYFGSSMAYWLHSLSSGIPIDKLLMFTFSLSAVCYIAFRRQRSIYLLLEKPAFEMMESETKKNGQGLTPHPEADTQRFPASDQSATS